MASLPGIVTKDEYQNKHERDIAVKMANLWEEKIGSETKHSPRTVLGSTDVTHENPRVTTRLSHSTAEKETETLQKKNTKGIVHGT